jgi:chloramphenicol-sensitive protein RarD
VPNSPTSPSAAGLAAGLLAYLWWGGSALYWALLAAVPAVDIVAHRALWCVPFCALLLLGRGGFSRALTVLRQPAQLALLALSAGLIALNWGLFVYAVNAQRLSESSLGYFLQPLVVMLVGVLVFAERPTRTQWLAIACAALGVTVYALSLGELPIVAVGIALSFAGYSALRKGLPVGTLDGLFIETLLLAPAALAWILSRGGAGLELQSWTTSALLLGAGAFTAVPLIAYVAAARRLTLVTLGFLFYVNPGCQLLLAHFWFGEAVDGGRLLAFGLVWTGLAIYLAQLATVAPRRRGVSA